MLNTVEVFFLNAMFFSQEARIYTFILNLWFIDVVGYKFIQQEIGVVVRWGISDTHTPHVLKMLLHGCNIS